MNSRIESGKEHGVEWVTDFSKFNPVMIHVKSEKGEETVVYNCVYAPIFGYDVDDMEEIERITETLIRKYATDGYGGGQDAERKS